MPFAASISHRAMLPSLSEAITGGSVLGRTCRTPENHQNRLAGASTDTNDVIGLQSSLFHAKEQQLSISCLACHRGPAGPWAGQLVLLCPRGRSPGKQRGTAASTGEKRRGPQHKLSRSWDVRGGVLGDSTAVSTKTVASSPLAGSFQQEDRDVQQDFDQRKKKSPCTGHLCTDMESDIKYRRPPNKDGRGHAVPRRLQSHLTKLQSEVMQGVPEGPRHCLSIDKAGQTQLLSVSPSMP